MTRRLASSIVAFAVGLGGLFVFLGMAQEARAEEIVADMSGNAFVPGDLTVSVGDTITWTNSDSVPHTVTSDDGGPLDSGIIDAGGTWSYTFTEPGTYSFYCEVHPNMKGTVTVLPAEAPTTTTAHGGGHDTTTTMLTPTTAAPPTTGAPPSTTATTTPAPPTGGGGDIGCSGALAAVEPFWSHFEAAHLETSLGQQVSDALNVDDYALAHTVLIGNMLKPILGALQPFLDHFEAAHLETSVGQQVSDALNVDDYVLAHTVLFDRMLLGTC